MDTQTVWQALIVHAIDVVAPSVMVLATYLVHKYVKNKMLADVLDTALKNGVSLAEEKGRQALNDGAPLEAKTKLEIAAAFVLKELEDRKYPELARDKLEALIEAKLGAERANPVGAVPSDPEVHLVDDGDETDTNGDSN